MKKITVILFSILWGAISTLATGQMPDWVIYNGKYYRLYSVPLETYFDKYPAKKPSSATVSSALHRGYIATFNISNAVMTVKDIQIETMEKNEDGNTNFGFKSEMNKFVQSGGSKEMGWFSGILVLPHGDFIANIGYSNFILLEIANGTLTREKIFSAEQHKAFKAEQYKKLKKSDFYKQAFDKLAEQGISPEYRDGFIQRNILSVIPKFIDEGNLPNQKLDPTVITPVESGKAQGTAGQL